MAKQRKWFIGAGIGIALLIGLAVASASTPYVFIQIGNHFFAGPNLASISGTWTCLPVGAENCEPKRETLAEAVRNDPRISNWWPWRIEFMTLD